jgi:hypothetical protein
MVREEGSEMINAMFSAMSGTAVLVLALWMTAVVLVLVWIYACVDGWQEHRYRVQYREHWIAQYKKYKRTKPHGTPSSYVKHTETLEKKNEGKKHPIDPPAPNFFPYWQKHKPNAQFPNLRREMVDEKGPRLFSWARVFGLLALVVLVLEGWFFIHVFNVKVDGNPWTETHAVLDKYIGWQVLINVVILGIGLYFTVWSEKLIPKYARSSYKFRDIPLLDEDERVPK